MSKLVLNKDECRDKKKNVNKSFNIPVSIWKLTDSIKPELDVPKNTEWQ